MTKTTFTKNEIAAKLTALVTEQALKGFSIVKGFTHDGWANIRMENKKGEIVEVAAQLTSCTFDKSFASRYKVELYVNDTVVETFYSLGNGQDGAYTTDESQVIEANELRTQRTLSRLNPYADREVTSPNIINAVKTIPGFRTVAKKNLRVFRLTGSSVQGYRVDNLQTGSQTKMFLNV